MWHSLDEEMRVEDPVTKQPESLRGIVLCKLLVIPTWSNQKKGVVKSGRNWI